MLGPENCRWLAAPLSWLPPSAPCPPGLWAYVGLGPGQEFIPQFLALLGLAATALLAVVHWPIAALLSRLSRASAARKEARKAPASAANSPEQPSEDNHADS